MLTKRKRNYDIDWDWDAQPWDEQEDEDSEEDNMTKNNRRIRGDTHIKHKLITSGLFFRIVCDCTNEVACYACKKLCRLVDDLDNRHLIRGIQAKVLSETAVLQEELAQEDP